MAAGFGGHSGYGFAVGYYLRRMGVEVEFLAVGEGWLVEKLSRLGRVHVAPLPRRPGEPLWRGLHRWPTALYRALRLVGRFDAVVVTGSNYSLPPALAARLRGVPVFSVESSVRLLEPSRATLLVDRLGLARATLLQWPEQARFYPRRGVHVGPLYEPPLYEPRDEGYVLVTAGSLGNPELFEAVVEAGFERAIVQTGRVDPGPLRARRPGWTFIRYTPDLHRLIAGASLVIAQFPGMTAMTAALAYGKPVVLVPARHLKQSARLENARLYARKIGAVYTEDLTPEGILEAARRARATPRPSLPPGGLRAARLIVEEISADGGCTG